MWQAGATLHRGAPASHCHGLSCCGAQAPDAQAQLLWLMGLVAPRHVGSSQTRARTRVPCISRQILNHCATREAHPLLFIPINPTLVQTLCYFVLLQLSIAASFTLVCLCLLYVLHIVSRSLPKTYLSLFITKHLWSAYCVSRIALGPRD